MNLCFETNLLEKLVTQIKMVKQPIIASSSVFIQIRHNKILSIVFHFFLSLHYFVALMYFGIKITSVNIIATPSVCIHGYM